MFTRRDLLAASAAGAVMTASTASLSSPEGPPQATTNGMGPGNPPDAKSQSRVTGNQFPSAQYENRGNDRAEDPRIRRARLSGPEQVTRDATIAELNSDGTMTVLVRGTNEWVCTPGDENKIGDPPMCMNPLGIQWMMDAKQGKPRPTNNAPGMIYMLCGATQRSNIDRSDKTSPAIPIGPHWMITWPFDAAANGLPTTVRDKGAWVMFAGTPYAYLHVCGTPPETLTSRMPLSPDRTKLPIWTTRSKSRRCWYLSRHAAASGCHTVADRNGTRFYSGVIHAAANNEGRPPQ